jgi:hypothetical protein
MNYHISSFIADVQDGSYIFYLFFVPQFWDLKIGSDTNPDARKFWLPLWQWH